MINSLKLAVNVSEIKGIDFFKLSDEFFKIKKEISLVRSNCIYSWLIWAGSCRRCFILKFAAFPSLPEEPSFQTHRRKELKILLIKLRAFANWLSALVTKNGQLVFLLRVLGENSHSIKNALCLRSDKQANSVPICP